LQWKEAASAGKDFLPRPESSPTPMSYSKTKAEATNHVKSDIINITIKKDIH
jgi:hypothetical protein